MITVLEMDSIYNKGTLGCRECMRLLEKTDSLPEPLAKPMIDFLVAKGEEHQRRHPKHVLTVTVYKKPDKIR